MPRIDDRGADTARRIARDTAFDCAAAVVVAGTSAAGAISIATIT
ncbi:hypothetical protein [Burkholderia puraquae]|nr:hypothetical protein [Burkholderia puraquae]